MNDQLTHSVSKKYGSLIFVFAHRLEITNPSTFSFSNSFPHLLELHSYSLVLARLLPVRSGLPPMSLVVMYATPLILVVVPRPASAASFCSPTVLGSGGMTSVASPVYMFTVPGAAPDDELPVSELIFALISELILTLDLHKADEFLPERCPDASLLSPRTLPYVGGSRSDSQD